MCHSLLPPIRNARRKHVSDSAISNELGTVVTPLTSATDEAPVVTHADQMANSGPEDASNRAATATVRPPSLAAKVPWCQRDEQDRMLRSLCDHDGASEHAATAPARPRRSSEPPANHFDDNATAVARRTPVIAPTRVLRRRRSKSFDSSLLSTTGHKNTPQRKSVCWDPETKTPLTRQERRDIKRLELMSRFQDELDLSASTYSNHTMRSEQGLASPGSLRSEPRTSRVRGPGTEFEASPGSLRSEPRTSRMRGSGTELSASPRALFSGQEGRDSNVERVSLEYQLATGYLLDYQGPNRNRRLRRHDSFEHRAPSNHAIVNPGFGDEINAASSLWGRDFRMVRGSYCTRAAIPVTLTVSSSLLTYCSPLQRAHLTSIDSKSMTS